MLDVHLDDDVWALIQPLLPPSARTGRPRADDRRTLDGILYVLANGCRWQDLPPEYGDSVTAWRRLCQWKDDGCWRKILRVVGHNTNRDAPLHVALAAVEASFLKAAAEWKLRNYYRYWSWTDNRSRQGKREARTRRPRATEDWRAYQRKHYF